jgi:hypothetical protein
MGRCGTTPRAATSVAFDDQTNARRHSAAPSAEAWEQIFELVDAPAKPAMRR